MGRSQSGRFLYNLLWIYYNPTGNVGALEGQELMEVIQKVKEYGGNCTLYVTARRDIYSQGPLLIDVRVERNDGR